MGDAEFGKPTALFGHRAVDRRIARVQPRYVVACRIGGGHLADDLIQCQRSSVDDASAWRAFRQQIVGHDRACVQAHRAALQQALTANRDQIGRTRPGTDEVHRHFRVTAATVSSHWVIGICGRHPVKPPNGSP